MSVKLVTLGSDPEVFLADGDYIVPSIGLIGGTKEVPLPVEKGAVQEDNVLAEFNIDPVTTEDMFVSHIKTVMGELGKRVAPLQLKILSSSHFDLVDLASFGPQAMVFGCEPDFCAWTESINPAPDSTSTLRTAGGHIHLGLELDDDDEKSRYQAVKLMDIFLGIPSVLRDDDVERRRMYGRAGACRLKSYGVEYRTLSNFWLRDEDHQRWAYRQSHLAMENFDNLDYLLKQISPEVIQNTINDSDVDSARAICADLQI